MRTCKVFPLTSFELASHLDEYLTSEQRARGSKQWCFRDNKRAYYETAYTNNLELYSFNQTVYKYILLNNPITSSVERYNTIKQSLPLYNHETWYAVQIFDNNIHTNTCVVSINANGNYHCAYSADNSMERWDDAIPIEYKEEVTYIVGEPYYPIFVKDVNIALVDNKLYVQSKEINDYGYYANIDDMFEFDGFGVCNIHLPFNIINMSHEFITQQLNTIEAHSYRIIGDNAQLRGKCDTVVLLNGSTFDISKIQQLPKFSIVKDSSSVMLNSNLFKYTEKI